MQVWVLVSNIMVVRKYIIKTINFPSQQLYNKNNQEPPRR